MKIIKTLMFLLFCGQFAMAQNTNLYVFYIENGTNDRVLSYDGINNKLKYTNIPSEKADYFDAFIVRPIPNKNSVYIIPAKKNNLFLRRNGDNIEFTEIPQSGNNSSFEWDIRYFGWPYCAIVNPSSEWQVIKYDALNAIYNVQTSERNLTSNSDSKGTAYRFKVKTIGNSF